MLDLLAPLALLAADCFLVGVARAPLEGDGDGGGCVVGVEGGVRKVSLSLPPVAPPLPPPPPVVTPLPFSHSGLRMSGWPNGRVPDASVDFLSKRRK